MSPPRASAIAFRLFGLISTLASIAYGAAGATVSPSEVPGATGENSRVENAVVKIFATIRLPDPFRPWTKESPREIHGSGVVIDAKRILTNAHMVIYASQVQIQANLSGDKIPAKIESVAPGIDLAVLKLEDESFFDTHPALARAQSLPSVKDSVLVYGFPTGGTSLSITKGIVSRIEFVSYHYPVSGLRVQVDAALNPGNSGGPAVVGDKMIGLANARMGGKAENIGYIIPCEEIEFFLKQVTGGRPYRKPTFFAETQTLENPALRTYLKIDRSVTGMVVTEPDDKDAGYPLKPWDVIAKIGDLSVDDEGMIHPKGLPQLKFTYWIQRIARDGMTPFTIVRQGKSLAIEVPTPSEWPMLIPESEGTYPSYFIFGPVSFTAVTTQFVVALTRNPIAMTALSVIASPLVTRRGDRPAFPGEQLVVVSSPLLPHRLGLGYSNPAARVVKSVNGIAIKNLGQLVTILRDSTDHFIIIEFCGRSVETMVFPRQEMVTATDEILTDNDIRSQGSPDAMAIWNAKPNP